jgi:hypothetical protein
MQIVTQNILEMKKLAAIAAVDAVLKDAIAALVAKGVDLVPPGKAALARKVSAVPGPADLAAREATVAAAVGFADAMIDAAAFAVRARNGANFRHCRRSMLISFRRKKASNRSRAKLN